MKIHEGIGGIPCEICGKIFRTMRAVERHAEIHAGRQGLSCNCYFCLNNFLFENIMRPFSSQKNLSIAFLYEEKAQIET